MDGDLSASSSTQRATFNIDLAELGVVLADAFIRRLDAFVASDRILILKACRERLAAEGGDVAEYLLKSPTRLHVSPNPSPGRSVA